VSKLPKSKLPTGKRTLVRPMAPDQASACFRPAAPASQNMVFHRYWFNFRFSAFPWLAPGRRTPHGRPAPCYLTSLHANGGPLLSGNPLAEPSKCLVASRRRRPFPFGGVFSPLRPRLRGRTHSPAGAPSVLLPVCIYCITFVQTLQLFLRIF
jgi:hypothetical protein